MGIGTRRTRLQSLGGTLIPLCLFAAAFLGPLEAFCASADTQQIVEQAAEKAAEKAVQKTTEKVAGQTTSAVVEKAAELAIEKAAEDAMAKEELKA